MKKKENLYPAIAAIASVPLSVTVVLGMAGGAESLFNELPLIVLIGALLMVMIIGFCSFFGTKLQIIEQQTKKLSDKLDSSNQTQSDLLQTQSDLLHTQSDSLKSLAGLSGKSNRQRRPACADRPKVPVFKIGVN